MIVVLTRFEVGPSMASLTLFDWFAIAVAELVCTGTSGEGMGRNGKEWGVVCIVVVRC